MIDRRIRPYSINLDIDIPHDNKEIIDKFIEDMNDIKNRYLGSPSRESLIIDMAFEIERLLDKPEYQGILVKNDEFYTSEYWELDKIVSEYNKHYPERADSNKKEYTNMEVNNMLFDLNIAGLIGKYRSPAIPYDIPSHNDKIFSGSVYLEVPVIRLGSQEDFDNIREYGLEPEINRLEPKKLIYFDEM